MLKLVMDFNSVLSGFLGSLPSGSIATEELDFSFNDKRHRLTAIRRGDSHRLALWDELGEACPGFEVVCMGQRLTPEEGEDSIDLGERSWLELASLHLYIEEQSLGFLQIVPEMPKLTSAEKELALEQRHAWQFFYQMRTCPPLEVLKQGSEDAERHLRACPSCRELFAGGERHDAWAQLAKQLKSGLPSPHIPQVQPGQVWSLHEDLEGGDGEGLYLRTPQVLILSKHGGIRTVPVCPETKLAGERDVFLGEEMGFAEAWNRLTLPELSLRECWGTVDEVRLQEAQAQACHTLPEAKTDLRRAFENLERHVAGAFEKRALVWALSQAREPKREIDLRPLFGRIRETLRAWFPSPLPVEIPVGADDRRTIPLRFCRTDTAEEDHYRATITSWILDEDGIHVSGKLLLPEGAVPSLLYAWLERNDEETVEAARSDIADIYFHLNFPKLEDVVENDLRLVAISYGG